MSTNEPNADALKTMPVADLYEYRTSCQKMLDEAKATLGTVDGAIYSRFGDAIKTAYERADKSHGTVRVELEGGLSAVGEASKKVKWDQPKLRALAAPMAWEAVQHFFKITFEIPEKVYAGLPPDDPRRAAINDARTVEYGTPKITLEKKA